MSSTRVFTFGGFELDASRRRLKQGGRAVTIPDRHLAVLVELVSHPGEVISKNALVDAAWQDVAVTDNSLEQAVSALRRALGSGPDGQPCIETVPRQGYRFTAPVTASVARASDEAIDALLAPHRAWVEGRSALETLERDQVLRARVVFEGVLEQAADYAPAHVGLANACVMQFEMTRADETPDRAALERAAHHAREACRLDPGYGEAWATLGFVLARTGQSADALAASRRAVALEPDHWRHHLRLAYIGWGEERIRASRRVLALLPGFPLAHWLAATVHVARGALDEAGRELAAATPPSSPQTKFSAVGLNWLRGLLLFARGDDAAARSELERELASEASGHLYARECCANTWYAIGALELRRGEPSQARRAFGEACARLAVHPSARAALARAAGGSIPGPPVSVDAAIAHALGFVLDGRPDEAARIVDHALAQAPPGSAGWLIPVEPVLRVWEQPQVWQPVLVRLRARAT